MKTLDDAPFLDIFTAARGDETQAVVEELRRHSWLVRTPIGGLVIGRSQVQALLADRHLRSSIMDFVRMQGITDGPLFDSMAKSLLAVDGEDHTRLRKLVSRAFTPRAVDAHRPFMRSTVESLLAPVRPTGRSEFMADISEHYPIEVMCELLGVPTEHHEDFARWNRSLTWALSFELSTHRDEVEGAMMHMREYVAGLLDDRRAHPRADLVTALVQAENDGDMLSDDELQTLIASLLFAGYDTTRNQLGLAVWMFASRPEQWEILAAHPELAAAAVEEVMRNGGAVGIAPRFVIEDFELDGYHLPAGTLLALSTAAANHDPGTFADPYVLDITVAREPQLTFGGGPHYCLGASLARAEMHEALPLLAQGMPGLELDGEPTWRPPMGIYGPETLPIRFTASTS